MEEAPDRTDLLARARALPAAPGVYLMKDAKGRVLYVGKARSLRERVSQYFAGPTDPKTSLWTPRVHEIETLPTRSEVDALLLEARLIKDVRPRYNHALKDGRTYPWLEITADPFPIVRVTREPRKGSTLYGPFTAAAELHQAAEILQGVFRFRTCDLEIRPDDPRLRFQRPCLLHWIDRCSAPCAGRIPAQAYARDLSALRMFVEGSREPLLDLLRSEMEEASAACRFERAALIRDRIAALESLSERGTFSDRPDATPMPLKPAEAMDELAAVLSLPRRPRVVEGIDIATIAGEDSVGSLVTFADGIPFKDGYRRFRIRTVEGMDDFASMREVVLRRYRRLVAEETPLPDLLMVDGGKGQLVAALAALREAGAGYLPVVSLAKREEEVFVPGRAKPLRLPRRSLALRFLQHVRDEAHRFAQHYHHLLRKRRVRPRRAHA